MARPALKRLAVNYVVDHYQTSRRRACRIVNLHRSNAYYQSRTYSSLNESISIVKFTIARTALAPEQQTTNVKSRSDHTHRHHGYQPMGIHTRTLRLCSERKSRSRFKTFSSHHACDRNKQISIILRGDTPCLLPITRSFFTKSGERSRKHRK